MKHYYIFFVIPSSSVPSLCLCHNYKLLLCYVVVPSPPTKASLFATHVMAPCCPGLWLMAAIQPEKFPWVGASWLTQRRNSLLLSVELTEQGGVWVIARVSVCVRARETGRERQREKPIFVHVSKCMHVCPPLLCTSHHAWISVSTCFKLSVKVTACPRAGIQVTWIISQKWRSPIPSAPCTHNRSNLSFLMNNLCAPCCFMTTVILLYSMVHMFGTYAFCLPISTHSHPPFTDKLALTCAEVNMAGGGDITPIYQFYVKANSC